MVHEDGDITFVCVDSQGIRVYASQVESKKFAPEAPASSHIGTTLFMVSKHLSYQALIHLGAGLEEYHILILYTTSVSPFHRD